MEIDNRFILKMTALSDIGEYRSDYQCSRKLATMFSTSYPTGLSKGCRLYSEHLIHLPPLFLAF